MRLVLVILAEGVDHGEGIGTESDIRALAAHDASDAVAGVVMDGLSATATLGIPEASFVARRSPL